MTYGRVGNISARLCRLCGRRNVADPLRVPALKYPANPPAVSLDETIRQRTLLYLLMVVLSAALFVGAVWLGRGSLSGSAHGTRRWSPPAPNRGGRGRDAGPADHRRDAGTAAR